MPDPTEHAYQPARVAAARERLVLISGCSGSGKSALLGELARRGLRTFPEAGREIVKEQLLFDGEAVPWRDPAAFVELTVSRSLHKIATAAACEDGLAFLDRGPVDAIAFLEHVGLPVPERLLRAAVAYRCHGRVFMTPPWPEIFRNDPERRHGFDHAAAEYETLVDVYRRMGYAPVEVPRGEIAARADFVLRHFAAR